MGGRLTLFPLEEVDGMIGISNRDEGLDHPQRHHVEIRIVKSDGLEFLPPLVEGKDPIGG